MAKSSATTVADYLAELPAERRAVISAVRKMVRSHLPKGYVEGMNWGMISYELPLAKYPDTYNGQPLMFAALAAQKNHYALYLSCITEDAQRKALKTAFEKNGEKLDMGGSCVRFKKLEGLPLKEIGAIIAALPVATFIKKYEASRKK